MRRRVLAALVFAGSASLLPAPSLADNAPSFASERALLEHQIRQAESFDMLGLDEDRDRIVERVLHALRGSPNGQAEALLYARAHALENEPEALEQAYDFFASVRPRDVPRQASITLKLAAALDRAGRYEEAVSFAKVAVDLAGTQVDAVDPIPFIRANVQWADSLKASGESELAQQVAESAYSRAKAVLGEGDPSLLIFHPSFAQNVATVADENVAWRAQDRLLANPVDRSLDPGMMAGLLGIGFEDNVAKQKALIAAVAAYGDRAKGDARKEAAFIRSVTHVCDDVRPEPWWPQDPLAADFAVSAMQKVSAFTTVSAEAKQLLIQRMSGTGPRREINLCMKWSLGYYSGTREAFKTLDGLAAGFRAAAGRSLSTARSEFAADDLLFLVEARNILSLSGPEDRLEGFANSETAYGLSRYMRFAEASEQLISLQGEGARPFYSASAAEEAFDEDSERYAPEKLEALHGWFVASFARDPSAEGIYQLILGYALEHKAGGATKPERRMLADKAVAAYRSAERALRGQLPAKTALWLEAAESLESLLVTEKRYDEAGEVAGTAAATVESMQPAKRILIAATLEKLASTLPWEKSTQRMALLKRAMDIRVAELASNPDYIPLTGATFRYARWASAGEEAAALKTARGYLAHLEGGDLACFSALLDTTDLEHAVRSGDTADAERRLRNLEARARPCGGGHRFWLKIDIDQIAQDLKIELGSDNTAAALAALAEKRKLLDGIDEMTEPKRAEALVKATAVERTLDATDFRAIDARLQLMRLRFQDGDTAAAKALADELREFLGRLGFFEPDFNRAGSAWAAVGKTYALSGETAKATQCAEALLILADRLPGFLYGVRQIKLMDAGAILLLTGDAKRAEAAFAQAVAIGERRYVSDAGMYSREQLNAAYLGLGEAQRAQHKDRDALQTFGSATTVPSAGGYDAWEQSIAVGFAELAYAEGNLVDARRVAAPIASARQLADTSNPRNREAILRFALPFSDRSLSEMQEGQEFGLSVRAIKVFLDTGLYQTDGLAGLLQHLEKIKSRAATRDRIAYELQAGRFAAYRSELDRAEQSYSRVLAEDPQASSERAQALIGMASIRQAQGANDEAEKLLQAAGDGDGDPMRQIELARIASAIGDKPRAMDLASSALAAAKARWTAPDARLAMVETHLSEVSEEAGFENPVPDIDLAAAVPVIERNFGGKSRNFIEALSARARLILASKGSNAAAGLFERANALDLKLGGTALTRTSARNLAKLAHRDMEEHQPKNVIARMERAYALLRLARESREHIGENYFCCVYDSHDGIGMPRFGRSLLVDFASSLPMQCRDPMPVTHDNPSNCLDLIEKSFELEQLVKEGAVSKTMADVFVRNALADKTLSQKMRELQDAEASTSRLREAIVLQTVAEPRPVKSQTGGSLAEQLSHEEARAEKLRQDLEKRSPGLDEQALSDPISLVDAGTALKPREALFMFLSDRDAAAAWLVAKTPQGDIRATMKSLTVSSKELCSFVDNIRLSLDPGSPHDCIKSNADATKFDGKSAFELYSKILAPFSDQLKETDHLITSLDGKLATLPLQLLLTSSPTANDPPSSQAWLLKRFSISTLPTINSLKQKSAAEARAPKAFFGVGNPSISQDERFRDLEELPDTEAEILHMSRLLAAQPSDLLLGSNATEAKVRRADLASYGIVEFATHALLATDIPQLTEPALVLTPPTKVSSAEDDGLLTASEVTKLKLNSDLVILSACNTAGSDGSEINGNATLSGLTRAFLYAGGRSLLVSQWPVDSRAVTVLIPKMIEMRKQGEDWSEALRKSAISLSTDPEFASPVYWAPFVLVQSEQRATQK